MVEETDGPDGPMYTLVVKTLRPWYDVSSLSMRELLTHYYTVQFGSTLAFFHAVVVYPAK